jgi:hypothetical protein
LGVDKTKAPLLSREAVRRNSASSKIYDGILEELQSRNWHSPQASSTNPSLLCTATKAGFRQAA